MPIWFNSRGYLDTEKIEFKVIDASGGAVLDRFEEDAMLVPMLQPEIWHGDTLVYIKPHRDNPFT